jgi:hypothetical protein
LTIGFRKKYFIPALILLIVEILIALYVHDAIIRPYIGDYLVVILLYCLLQSFINAPVVPAAIIVLIFSFVIETLQYFKIVEVLGLQHSTLARVIIGTSFHWIDLVMYALGIVTVLLIEHSRRKYYKL